MMPRVGEREEVSGLAKGKNYEDGTYGEYHNRNDMGILQELEEMEGVEVQRQQIRVQKASNLPRSPTAGYYSVGERPNGIQSSTSMAPDPISGSCRARGFLATNDQPTAKLSSDPRGHTLPALTSSSGNCSKTLNPQEDNQLQSVQSSRAPTFPLVDTPQYEQQYTRPHINPSGYDHPVMQDYERQLHILEQQNKKRLMVARREQEHNDLPPLNPSTDNNHLPNDYQMQLLQLEQQNKKRLMMARQDNLQDYQILLLQLEHQNKKRLIMARQEHGVLPPTNPSFHNDNPSQYYQAQQIMLDRQNMKRGITYVRNQDPPPVDGDHTSEDSYMQVDELEQQNKKRNMMAKQEQEQEPLSFNARPCAAIDLTMDSRKTPDSSVEQSNRATQQSVILPSLPNTGKPKPDDYQMSQLSVVRQNMGAFLLKVLDPLSQNPSSSQNHVDITTSSVPTPDMGLQTIDDDVAEQTRIASDQSPVTVRGSINHDTPSSTCMSPFSTPGPSQDDESNCPQLIDTSAPEIPQNSCTRGTAGLPADVSRSETIDQQQELSRMKIIYRICQDGTSMMYFEPPQWTIDETNSRNLTNNLPVSDMSSYLDEHPEIAFIVYRDYDAVAMDKPGSTDAEQGIMPPVKHTSENLEPITRDLTLAVTAFMERIDNLANPRMLSAPYLIFYHTRDVIENFLTDLAGQQQAQFKLLLEYVFLQQAEEYEMVDSLLESGNITSPYIKYLFKPGDVLVEGKGQNVRGFLSTSWPILSNLPSANCESDSRMKRWDVEAWSWKFNGVFWRQNYKLSLEINADDLVETSIDELNIRPLTYVSENEVKILQRRGETLWKCRTRHYVSYHEDGNREYHHSGDERYMIDFKIYRELHQAENSQHQNSCVEVSTGDLGAEEIQEESPPNNKFIYLHPLMMVKGYSLKNRKWRDLEVDRIAEVVWNKEVFDSIVLDRKMKGLIQALISNRIEVEKSTDLMNGKGNGSILLFQGGPGTGKTLTAESVAEIAEKPLYPIDCRAIGTEPKQVEDYLKSALTLGETWGCVVLLEGADVLLEQRSGDHEHNAMVSVFFRALEYYDGIVILTASSRAGPFNKTFKSHIQLAIHYPELGPIQRRKIWSQFIQRLERLEEENVNFSDLIYHVSELARTQMNGRQIRNAMTTARQYAEWKEEPLDYLFLKDIIETMDRSDICIGELDNGYRLEHMDEDSDFY
ncbi:hypothetical protein B7494_g2824 [Chlorociboria aeruginascens]|nr:hypothetical protein B7494_g2824 [Chlorociboria aeruginascens]